MSGISGVSGGHLGAAGSTRTANTLSNIGSAAFNTVLSAGTVAAGAFGGPAAASAVNSFRGLAGGGGGGNDAFGSIEAQSSGTAAIVGDIQSDNRNNISQAGEEATAAQSFQVELFRLQSAINSQSQTNNMITNMQKARHDAMVATIQNSR